MGGIYALVIKDFSNEEKVYIGSTTRPYLERKGEHLYDLRKGTHPNTYLQRCYDKYQNLEFRVLEDCFFLDLPGLTRKEQFWIDVFSGPNLLNLGPAFPSPKYGATVPLEVREKISRKNKGRKLTKETKSRMSKSHTGVPKGALTEETKRRISETKKRNPKVNPMQGKHHSEESKRRMSETRKKKWEG